MVAEVRKFDAEVGKVLQLMIHSLYTNKDIFLRELISNASDACDKLRYESLNGESGLEVPAEFKISIQIDQDKGEIVISDNGIGMDKKDLINNLGTIASSGTQRFIDTLTEANKPEINQIGQFGVGFYSAFIVADKVTVLSRKASAKKTYKWVSSGQGEYEVGEAEEKMEVPGTKITLHVKEREVEFLEKHRLKHIITTYSDHISFPIELIDESGKGEVINTASALWCRPKSEITEESYNEFYHHVSHLPDNPWMRLHIKAEGNLEYTSLLFIPSIKPYDLFHPDRKSRVKLYVKRVFITEEAAQLMPSYLRFLRGIVDSEDLPLNINRETLQYNMMIEKIRKSLVKKVLGELKSKAKSDPKSYQIFWNNFGEVMKEGLCEGAFEDKEQLLGVCRFHSSKSDADLTSIDEYIDRMVEGQDTIFYITGDKLESLRLHPQLEGFMKRDIEVLLLPDHVDDFWVSVFNAYKNKEFKSVNAQDIDLNSIKKLAEEDKATNENAAADEKQLIDYIKNVIGSSVREVKISSKLVDSPACLSVPTGAMSVRMERYLLDQKQLKTPSAKIFEINPKHPVIAKISNDVAADQATADTEDLVKLIYDQACVLEGEAIQDPVAFMRRMNNFLAKVV